MRWLLVLVPVLAAAGAFFPITRVYFYADDFLALYALANGTGSGWLLTPFGGHLLPVRNLAYALTWAAAGTDPGPYLWSVLVTHLVIVALLFTIVWRASGRALLATVIATLWGTCAMHVGTLGWYATYGHVLAALAFTVVLAAMVARERRSAAVGGWEALGWAAVLLAGGLSFGTGLAIVLVYPVLLMVVFPRERLGRTALAVALALPPLVLALYAASHLYSPAGGTNPVRSLIGLHAGVAILVQYLAHLLAGGAASLVLGAAWERARYPDATTTLAASLVAAGILGGLVAGPARKRRLITATLLAAVAAYAAVAMGRAGPWNWLGNARAENPLTEGAKTLRYHYLGQLALAATLGVALGALSDRLRVSRRLGLACGVGALGVIVAATWLHPPVVWDYEEVRRNVRTLKNSILARIIHDATRRDALPRQVHLANHPWNGGGPLIQRRPAGFPGTAAFFVIYFPSDVVGGREVRFVSDDPAFLAARAAGGRVATLLVPGTPPPEPARRRPRRRPPPSRRRAGGP